MCNLYVVRQLGLSNLLSVCACVSVPLTRSKPLQPNSAQGEGGGMVVGECQHHTLTLLLTEEAGVFEDSSRTCLESEAPQSLILV